MKSSWPVTRVVFCVILVCFLTSCMTWHPERYATVEEAYPSKQAYQITPDVPADSYKKVVFDAPYTDVFRAVEVAATQVGLNIESSDKSKGLILATRVFQGKPIGYRNGHLFYAITVKELKSRTTEVVVFVKLQAHCVTATPDLDGINKRCMEYSSTPHVATGRDADDLVLSQFINFTRNNLIAAGAL